MDESASPYISVIIPAYNEAQRLENSIATLRKHMDASGRSYEVILVIEKSSDASLEIARNSCSAPFEVIGNEVRRGKGYAVRCGMLCARGEIAFYMDADLSTSLADMERFITHMETYPYLHVIIGNRQHRQSQIMRLQSTTRRNMGKSFNLILRSITGLHWQDTQCGFKAFRASARQEIFSRQRLDGFAFDAEVLLLAKALGFQVQDMPVEWTNAEGSKVHIFRDSVHMLLDTLRLPGLVRRAVKS
jgi:dolichyl-phosphate beta-glucosyltransferase